MRVEIEDLMHREEAPSGPLYRGGGDGEKHNARRRREWYCKKQGMAYTISICALMGFHGVHMGQK
jgi:hypothetical protein